MKKPPFRKDSAAVRSPASFQQKIKDADTYVSQGLFEDAWDVYESLILQIHAIQKKSTERSQPNDRFFIDSLKLLEEKIQALQAQMHDFERRRVQIDLKAIRNALNEADVYVSNGLFSEAIAVYEFLSLQIQSWIEENRRQGKKNTVSAQTAIKILEDKTKKLHAIIAQDDTKRVVSSLNGLSRSEEDNKLIFNLALALKGFELHDDTVNILKYTEPADKKTINSYQEIAVFLIQEGESAQGIEILRTLSVGKHFSSEQRLDTLLSLAEAYEFSANQREALKTYKNILELDRSHTKALKKTEALKKSIRRFRFDIAAVTEQPRLYLFLSIILAAFFMCFLPEIKTVNNVDYYTLENDPDITYYDQFKEIFGNDEFFVVAFEKDNLFTKQSLDLLNEITQELETIEEAEEVKSLANVDDIIGESDYFEVRRFLEEIPDDPSELEKLKSQARKNPLYVDNFISRDGTTASIVIKTYDRPEDKDYRKKLIEKTESVLNKYNEDFHLAGWTLTNLRLSQYMKNDVAKFVPLTFVFITIAIWFFFRNLILTMLAILNITICAGSVMGLFGLTGIEMHNVTSIIPSMIMALALCDTVHIFSHLDRRTLVACNGDRKKSLATILKQVIWPSFLTTLTTAVGFLSLSISDLPPIRDFAWISAGGMFFEFFYSFFFLPPMLLLFPPEKIYQDYQAQRGITLFLRKNVKFINKNYRIIALTGFLLIIGAIWMSSKVKVETSAIGTFKPNSPLRQSLNFVEKRLGGVDSLDISIVAEKEDAFKDPSNLRILETIQRHVDSLKGVDKTVSFIDYLKDMNESFHDENPQYRAIPEKIEMVSQYLLLYDAEDIEDVINNTFDHARIAARISLHKSSDQALLIKKIEDFVDTIGTSGFSIRVTGRVLNDVVVINELVNGQIYSLALASILISLIMFLALRSLPIGFLSILANFFPVILNFGFMGLMNIPLDTGTALIAAVAIGIAVDDTVHFLSEYKKQRGMGNAIPITIKMVIFLKGRAIFSSSFILCIGFGVVILSNFIPTMNFGILITIVMMTALIGDIVFLPAVIMLKKVSLSGAVSADH